MRRKGLVIGLAIFGFGLLTVLFGYLWAKHFAWSKVQSLAAEYGVLLEKPDIHIDWQGGLQFDIRVTDLKGSLTAPLPASGPFTIPLLQVRASFDQEMNLAVIDEMTLQGLTADVVVYLKESAPEPPEEESRTVEIPRAAAPTVTLDTPIETPVWLDLRKVDLRIASLKVDLKGESNAQVQIHTARLEGFAKLLEQETAANLKLSVENLDLDAASPSQRSSVKGANFDVEFKTGNTAAAPLTLQTSIATEIHWKGLAFRAIPAPGEKAAEALWFQDEGGRFELSADAETAQLKVAGARMTSSLSKKPTDWTLALKPVRQTETASEVALEARVPQLLTLDAQIKTARKVQLETPKAQVNGQFSFHPDLALLVMDEMPVRMKGQMAGDFHLEVSGRDHLNGGLQLKGQGVNLGLQAEADLAHSSGQATGSIVFDFDRQPVEFGGRKFAGRVAAPFKLILRNEERFYAETEMRLQRFSMRSKEIDVIGATGRLPITQSWSFTKGNWDLNPRLRMNAFARADAEAYAPLERTDYALLLDRLRINEQNWGPVELELRLNQNLLRSDSWRLGLPHGRFEGALLLDLKIDSPKLGLLTRAYLIHPGEILPEGTGRGEWLSQPLSFFMGMDWDIEKAEALGRIDWSHINSAQVMGLLDILDPQYENKTYNQARTLLATAYPTRVQVDLRGRVADIRINTNVTNLPEVRNVPLSPYLLRANEMLYENESYQRLRRGL